MKLAERLLDQAQKIQEAEEGSPPKMEDIGQALFDAAQEIERLEGEVTTAKEEVNNTKAMADLGAQKIKETKDETLRLLKVICEHSETKDMGRHDRMKERFEKEDLGFADIERYYKDAQAEFEVLFPESGRAVAGDPEDKNAKREAPAFNCGAYKIGSK